MKWPGYRRKMKNGGVAVLVLVTLLCSAHSPTKAATDSTAGPAWASPDTKSMTRLSSVSPHQNEPDYLNNLDCSLETYHLTDDNTMQSGCFTDTAFGQVDADSDMVIFNGTDEAVPLVPYVPHEVLAPWPKSLDMVALDPQNSGGQRISLYRNPVALMQDDRTLLGKLHAKHLRGGPDLPLVDSTGKPLIINAQSMAFSSNGSWLVIEVLNGSFERINLATLDATPFGVAYSKQGSSQLAESAVSITPDGHYVVVENSDANEFKVYDLTHCTGASCASYNYWPFIAQQISSLRYLSHVRFVNDSLISFDATSSTSSVSGTYEIAPTASIHSLIDYLGLGDSYTSGEGAFDYLDGTDTDDDRCHLSSHAYPLLLTRDLLTPAAGHSVAGSGAVIKDIGDNSDAYRGQNKGVGDWQELNQNQASLLASVLANFIPGYVAQQRYISQYQPNIITVGVGGNDVGFASILERCAAPKLSAHLVDNTCYATYEDRQELLNLITSSKHKLQALYEQLSSEAPASTLYVIGYPEVSVDTGNCALNVHFNTDELEFVDEVIAQLNSTIAAAASSAGVHYVDISQALVGHRLCETSQAAIAMNGVTAGTAHGVGEFSVIGSESYHPNALGQELIEQSILRQTNRLKSNDRINSSPTAPGKGFSDKPKSGRPIDALLPEPNLTSKRVGAGAPLTLTVDGLRDGLVPGNTYTIRLDGSQGAAVRSITTDTNGDAVTTIQLPATTESGLHTIDVTGQNQAGQPVDVTQPVYVDAGNKTVVSGCPLVGNSGQDADHDGIDDACDPVISGSSTSSGTNLDADHTATSVISSATPLASQTATFTSTPSAPNGAHPAITAVASPISGVQTIDGNSRSPAVSHIRYTPSPDLEVSPKQHPEASSAKIPSTDTIGAAGYSYTSAHHRITAAANSLKIIYWLPWLIGGTIVVTGLKMLDAYLYGRTT